ncbi:MAG: RDD family protein [Melioribacteraceae bacterium]|nr:RDD family protein [Melioribacteraceae bacterium]MCF8264138.1 RDD family protein [Melioribacteraceae bacterium]MCF8413795.1 RDD family protein [Melioribacteraceae bacterium]MCF8430762.1 RDD family protein [Melioribacteraceae bacterium]
MKQKNILGPRLLAFGIDYLLLIIYASILYFATTGIFDVDVNNTVGSSPFMAQFIGFVTLTLPVFLYFYLQENSAKKSTIGKKIMGLRVEARTLNKSRSILMRNILKFLPWEAAHFGVHQMFYFSSINEPEPLWVWVFLILPQLIVLMYFSTIIISKGRAGFYDVFAGTKIEKN